MEDKARQYSAIKHRIAVINIILAPLVLLALLALGIPAYFNSLTHSFTTNEYINLIIFYLLTAGTLYLITLPLEFYSGFLLEHRFSLSNQTFKIWLKRELKKNLVAFVISAPLVMALYAFLKIWPVDWWLWTALLWFLASIILAKFAPIVIVPLFYKYSPLKDQVLSDRMSQLVKKAGFRPSGVYELDISRDTKKANAALLGLGRQKRIVLCDTLISNFTHDEIEAVMAHELGHHKLNHMWKLIISGGIFTILTFFFANMLFLKMQALLGYSAPYGYDALVAIYLAVSVFSIPFIPISNAFSRRLEKDADIFSIKTTGNVNAFISTMKRLGEQNLADLNPARFYEIMLYDHPPIARRIALAESFKNNT